MKKKFITMALVASMVLSMTACGKKAASESSASSGSTVAASSKTESASKEQIILNDVIEDIKNAGVLKPGDETNRIITGDGEKEFAFSGKLFYFENGSYSYDEDYRADGNLYVTFYRYDGAKESEAVVDMWQDRCLTTPEGIYVSPGTEITEGFMFIADSSEDGKHFDIVLSLKENADPQASSDLFLQLVQDFLKSDNVKVHSMSNVTFDTETLRFSME